MESGLARSSASQTSLGKTRPVLLACAQNRPPPPPFLENKKRFKPLPEMRRIFHFADLVKLDIHSCWPSTQRFDHAPGRLEVYIIDISTNGTDAAFPSVALRQQVANSSRQKLVAVNDQQPGCRASTPAASWLHLQVGNGVVAARHDNDQYWRQIEACAKPT